MVRTSSSNPMSIIRSASSRQRYLKCTVKKKSVHGNVKSLISKQILLIQYAFEIFVSKALFIWSPDIVPQINIDQESIKWIFNSGLFWAVEAAEKKKSKLP